MNTYLSLSQVVALSNAECEVRSGGDVRTWSQDKAIRWRDENDAIIHGYKCGVGVPGSGGVDIGDVTLRFKVVPLQVRVSEEQ